MNTELQVWQMNFPLVLLNADTRMWEFEEIIENRKEIFVIIEERFLKLNDCDMHHASRFESQKNAIAIASRRIDGALAIYSAKDEDLRLLDDGFIEAKKELEANGDIKGYIVYCVDSNIKVWISEYDWNRLVFLAGANNEGH